MTSAAKHTAGPVISNGHTIRTADENNITRRRVATAHGPFGDAEKAANAELIAEAFNVAHETGLTPRQLAERCAKLETTLESIVDMTKPGQTVNVSQATDIICDVWNVARCSSQEEEG